jgi:hypothetical protein
MQLRTVALRGAPDTALRLSSSKKERMFASTNARQFDADAIIES